MENVRINVIKELMREPFASNVRAETHFLEVCTRWGADPEAVLTALTANYAVKNAEFKAREAARFEQLKKEVEVK